MEIMITILLIFLLFCLHRIVVLEKRISLNKDRFFITLSEIIETNTMLLEQKDSLKEEKKQLSEEFVRLKKFLLMNDLFRDCLLGHRLVIILIGMNSVCFQYLFPPCLEPRWGRNRIVEGRQTTVLKTLSNEVNRGKINSV